MLWASLDGRRVKGRKDTCISKAESLRYLPETTTALLISYPPIQNIFGIKKNVINDGACLESKCFDLAHMNSLCSPGGVDPSSVQFCSSHFSGF